MRDVQLGVILNLDYSKLGGRHETQCWKLRQNHQNRHRLGFSGTCIDGQHRVVGLFGHHSIVSRFGWELPRVHVIGHFYLQA